jgi:hypothetical protein
MVNGNVPSLAFRSGLRASRQKAVFMLFRGRPFARLAVLSAGLALTAPLPRVTPAANQATGDQMTSGRPEVRLRKLHLVRPDLIPYPIAYEIYC